MVGRTVICRTVDGRTGVGRTVVGQTVVGRTGVGRTVVSGTVVGRANVGLTVVGRKEGRRSVVSSAVGCRTVVGSSSITDGGRTVVGRTVVDGTPIYGTGQGSGNSPAIWCFISSLLYDCYDKKAAKAMYITPDPIDPKQSNLVWSDSLMIRMGRQIYLLAKNRIAHNNKF
jgi:hypothetical protein